MELARRHLDILHKLNPETGPQWAPTHFIAKDLGRVSDNGNMRQVMQDLRELALAGYLQRDQPYNKKSKHSAWSRTQKADALFKETPKRSKVHFEHQVLDDMDTLSLQFGINADSRFKLERWHDIILSGVVPQTTLDIIRSGNNPHHIHMKETPHAFIPDGHGPLKISFEDTHIYTLKEIDRDTEQAMETEKSKGKRQTWQNKIRNIKSFAKNKYWKSHYGLDCFFMRIVTVNESAKQTILDVIKEEIGSCKYIGVAAWKDWGNHNITKMGEEKYPPADGWSFTTAYDRVGHEPYLLNKFFEMDK